MRQIFAKFLETQIEHDPSILVITADLGYGLFDTIQARFPRNFVNCGAAEHLMTAMCVGAVYAGRTPVAYSITPFLLYRPFEVIRNYINKESLNVKLIGSGRHKDYHHDGFSHWAEEDAEVMRVFTNIHARWPTLDTVTQTLQEAFTSTEPYYINLCR